MDRSVGESAIAAAKQLAFDFLAKYQKEVPQGAFDQGGEVIKGETDGQLRRKVLRTLQVVITSRGRGGPGVVAPAASDIYPRVIAAGSDIWNLLSGTARRATAKEIEEANKKHGLDPHHDGPTNLLKILGLAAGIQRAGGLRPYEDLEKEAADEAKDAEKTGDPSKDVTTEPVETKAESAYYELFANFIERWGDDYQPTVLGVAQVGRGEWSTPDVVAISVQRAPSLVAPIVRVATVEVKREVTRLAIAEAAAHRRFAHYAYVGTPQPLPDIDPALVTELSVAGLGLICPRQRGSLTMYGHMDPPLGRPDEEEVEFLLQRFSTADGEMTLSEHTRNRVRRAMAVVFE